MVLEALFLGRFKIPKDDIRSLLEQYRFKSLLENGNVKDDDGSLCQQFGFKALVEISHILNKPSINYAHEFQLALSMGD